IRGLSHRLTPRIRVSVRPPRRASMRELGYGEARAEALRTALRENPRVVTFGDLRGPHDPPNGIAEEFGERLFEPPISETAYIGAAAGLALSGWRPFCDTHTS